LVFDQIGESVMPRGEKSAYTDKQKRKAEHIEEGYIESGIPKKEAQARAWATVNNEDGGGKRSGSGRKPAATKTASAYASAAKKASARTITKH
jgi:plasmid stabilization system protein ParE